MAESGAEGERETEEPEFLNRAARRAKGKKGGRGGAIAQSAAQPHGRDAVQSRRQYGNRRTGG
jgi:hypothetical protein